MKRFWFWGALVLIGAAWLLNVAFYQSVQLKEPIVLKHYIDQPMGETHYIKIYYLTDRQEPTILQSMQVNGVTIPNLSSSNDEWLYGNQNSIYNPRDIVQEFNHHLLVQAEFDPSMLSPEGVEDKPLHLTDVFLSFSDGTNKSYEIGEIHLTPPINSKEPKLMEVNSAIGTSGGLHGQVYVADQPLQMDELQLPNALKDLVNVKVHYDGEEGQVQDFVSLDGDMPDWDEMKLPLAQEVEWPLELGSQGSVGIYVQIDSATSTTIDARLHWTGKTDDGEEFVEPVRVHHIPQLTDEEVDELITQSGVTR